MSQPRILILDDNPQVLEVARRMMDRLGFDASIVDRGVEAVRLYQEAHGTSEAFSVVIADLSVPDGMGGLECLGHLSQIDPQVKVIACTGHSEDPVLLNYKELGFVAALEKPFRLRDVKIVLEQILD